jgi:hypothetical protein
MPIPGNGLHDRCRRQTIPGNPPTKRVYIRISLRGQFLYLTVSMRLMIFANGNGANFTVLSVATQQSWKDSKDQVAAQNRRASRRGYMELAVGVNSTPRKPPERNSVAKFL